MNFHFTQKKLMLFSLLVAAFSMQMNAHNGLRVSPRLFLAGSYEASTGLMRDGIRQQGLLPMKEPYSTMYNFEHFGGGGGETIVSPSVMQTTGNNAIVDWVMVELRSSSDRLKPVGTRSALLQRDGDVVSTDGVSPVNFTNLASGDYYVVVRHRNHLGVMTAKPLPLSNTATLVDFTNTNTLLYGTKPCATIGGKRVLWLGDANVDKKVIHQGPANDLFSLYSAVLSAPANATNSGNFILKGYLTADLNMDGYAAFYGPNNDKAFSFQQAAMNGSGILNYILTEQIPD
ncbi:MAG: hypothetical protein IPN76_19965 [Saprospiraceae bacterium]|nr:hypothetical protein [Saprospiraceae bacterium]